MRRFVLALTAFAAFGGSAFAADLPARTYTKAPMLERAYNWTGFYVFGGAGGGIWDADSAPLNNTNGNAILINQRQGGDGWYGTVGAGYDWQFNQAWVAGIFADGQFGSLRGSITGALSDGTALTGTEKLQDTWAIGGRVGWLVAPMVLSYVNGGYTQSHWSDSALAPIGINPIAAATPSFSRGGWFVGGGVENNLNIFGISAPGWFMKTEYRLARFDAANLVEGSIATGAPTTVSTSFQPLVQTISTSIVYRFNSGGPTGAMAPAYTKAPVTPASAINWTGFYLSGGVGGGIWDADSFPFNNANLNIGQFRATQRQGGDGWFGTVGAGYDWQFNQTWVAGVFADGQFGNLKGSITGSSGEVDLTGTEKLRDTWAVGARVGWLVAPNVLSYVNGGYTQSYWSGPLLGSIGPDVPGKILAIAPSFDRGGWFVGGGVENNLNIFGMTTPGWFMKTEYRAARFDTANLVEGTFPSGIPFFVSTSFKPLVQTVSTSLVYRFNSPVVAKY
jgi:outer membrane immunogenic protein